MTTPAFYDFVFTIVADYEGHEEASHESRYFVFPQNWLSSFGEMYTSVEGNTIEDLIASNEGTVLKLSSGIKIRFGGNHIDYGKAKELEKGAEVRPICHKNIEFEPCELDFIKSIVIGKRITSAGDFGTYLELGLDKRFNLGLHANGFHIFSTENPVTAHKL